MAIILGEVREVVITDDVLVVRGCHRPHALLLIELLEFELILRRFVRIWRKGHLCLVHLIEHHRGFDAAHLIHLKARLIDSLLVDPGAARILHVGGLVELRGLLSSTRRHAKRLHTPCGSFVSNLLRCLELSDRARFDGHLGLELAPLRADVLGRLLEDKLFRGQVRLLHV